MKLKRFAEEEIIAVFARARGWCEGGRLGPQARCNRGDACHWKAQYGGMNEFDAKSLRALEDENAKLKKLLADQMLEASALCIYRLRRHASADPGRSETERTLVTGLRHDQFACGQRFRVLNIVEDVTSECLTAVSTRRAPDTALLAN